MEGLAWLDETIACDLLRVSEDNLDLIAEHALALPSLVEVSTGYPAEVTADDPDELVKALCRAWLQLLFNPDGTDADKLTKMVDSLSAKVHALAIDMEADHAH